MKNVLYCNGFVMRSAMAENGPTESFLKRGILLSNMYKYLLWLFVLISLSGAQIRIITEGTFFSSAYTLHQDDQSLRHDKLEAQTHFNENGWGGAVSIAYQLKNHISFQIGGGLINRIESPQEDSFYDYWLGYSLTGTRRYDRYTIPLFAACNLLFPLRSAPMVQPYIGLRTGIAIERDVTTKTVHVMDYSLDVSSDTTSRVTIYNYYYLLGITIGGSLIFYRHLSFVGELVPQFLVNQNLLKYGITIHAGLAFCL
jgi:hypothetical protein